MLQFEGFTLDFAHNSLRAADRNVQLRPKAVEVLHYLADNANRLVTKEELIQAIWPNVIVTDEVLTHCVSEVRQAIGDSQQNIIVTVPRRGYRFTAPVVRIAASAAAPPPALPTEPTGTDSGPRSQSPLLDRPSVAVLPFANLSDDAQQDYFSDGISEDIITELSRFSELLVIARNSSFQYKGKAVDIGRSGGSWAHATYWKVASGATATASASRRSLLVPTPAPTAGPSATTATCATFSRSRTRWRARLSRPSRLM